MIRLLILLGLWYQAQAHTSGCCYDTALNQFYFLTYHGAGDWTGMDCDLLVITSPSGAVTALNWTDGKNALVPTSGSLDPTFPNVYPDVCHNISATAIPVLTDAETGDTDDVESYGIIPFELTEGGWYNFSSPASGKCGSGPTFVQVPDWRMFYYVTPTSTPTPTAETFAVSLTLGMLALESDRARAWFAATHFNETSTITNTGSTVTYVLVSESPTLTVPLPTTAGSAAATIIITSFGPGVKKAVVQAFAADGSGEVGVVLPTGTDQGLAACLFQVDRMDDTGTMMNDQPFSFTVASNNNSLLQVTSFETQGNTLPENVATAGGSITLSADGATFTVTALHTSAFYGVYPTPSSPWAWWLLFLLLLVPIGIFLWYRFVWRPQQRLGAEIVYEVEDQEVVFCTPTYVLDGSLE